MNGWIDLSTVLRKVEMNEIFFLLESVHLFRSYLQKIWSNDTIGNYDLKFCKRKMDLDDFFFSHGSANLLFGIHLVRLRENLEKAWAWFNETYLALP